MGLRPQRPRLRHALAPLAVGAALAGATAADASPVLMTHQNSTSPAVGGGRVFWAQQHGRHAEVRMARPGGKPRTIFRITGPHARSAPAYAEIVQIAASARLVAFTVSAGYGDPFTCGAIEELPAGDPRCTAGRETVSALYAGPIGGPYRQLSGVDGRRASGCLPGTGPGTIDVSGDVVAWADVDVHCNGHVRSATGRLVVRGGGGSGRERVLATCVIYRTSDPHNDRIALAGDYLAWSPDTCDRKGRIRLFRWRTGKQVYRLPYYWYLDPFDMASDGTVIGQHPVSQGGSQNGYLVSFSPAHHSKVRTLKKRFGSDVTALAVSPHSLAVEYAPSDTSSRDVLITSDRRGNHRSVVATGLVPDFPWMAFDGAVAAWTSDNPPVRLYAERAPQRHR